MRILSHFGIRLDARPRAAADPGSALIGRDFGDYLEAGTTASALFLRVKPGEFRDVTFIEQAIRLGRFGVLAFLYPEDKELACLAISDPRS